MGLFQWDSWIKNQIFYVKRIVLLNSNGIREFNLKNMQFKRDNHKYFEWTSFFFFFCFWQVEKCNDFWYISWDRKEFAWHLLIHNCVHNLNLKICWRTIQIIIFNTLKFLLEVLQLFEGFVWKSTFLLLLLVRPLSVSHYV